MQVPKLVADKIDVYHCRAAKGEGLKYLLLSHVLITLATYLQLPSFYNTAVTEGRVKKKMLNV